MQQRRKGTEKSGTAGSNMAAYDADDDKEKRHRPDFAEEAPSNVSSMDLPQGFVDEPVSAAASRKPATPSKRMRQPGQKRSSMLCFWFRFLLLISIIVGASLMLVMSNEQQKRDVLEHEWRSKYQALTEETNDLHQQLEQKSRELNTVHDTSVQESSKLVKQVKYYQTYQIHIRKAIKNMSRTLLLEKFGPGPHHVEINLSFVDNYPKINQDLDTNEATIVVELASVDDMPHAVYWFLEQVTRNLYDGCSFHRNAGHVMQGGPQPNHLTPPISDTFIGLQGRFRASGFEKILVQEYSPNFPHKIHTMGYAGRPGGPDFYISTQDNVKMHGPGGQQSYDDPTEADPCFAKIISGTEVVDRMQLGPVKPGGYRGLEDFVAITSMKLIGYTGQKATDEPIQDDIEMLDPLADQQLGILGMDEGGHIDSGDDDVKVKSKSNQEEMMKDYAGALAAGHVRDNRGIDGGLGGDDHTPAKSSNSVSNSVSNSDNHGLGGYDNVVKVEENDGNNFADFENGGQQFADPDAEYQ